MKSIREIINSDDKAYGILYRAITARSNSDDIMRTILVNKYINDFAKYIYDNYNVDIEQMT